jgi:hypothetical protein
MLPEVAGLLLDEEEGRRYVVWRPGLEFVDDFDVATGDWSQ